jgi:hypothetical protein
MGAMTGGAIGLTTGGAIATGGVITIGATGVTVGGATATGGAVTTGAIGLGATITGIVPMAGFGVTAGEGGNAAGAGVNSIFGLVIGSIVVTGFTGATGGFSGAVGALATGGIGLGCPTGGCGAF